MTSFGMLIVGVGSSATAVNRWVIAFKELKELEARDSTPAVVLEDEPEVMPVPGQRLSRGLDLAAELLQGGGYPRGDVLLLPVTAVFDQQGAAVAYVPGRAGPETRQLDLGASDGSFVANRECGR